MSNIWHYSTTADGLYSNNPTSIVGDRDGNIFAVFQGGVSMLPNGAGRWNTILSYSDAQGGVYGYFDICVNEQSGAMYASCSKGQSSEGGLFVRLRNGTQTFMITQQNNGIASNRINAIAVNYSYSTQDPLGAVRLLHGDVHGISKYHVEPGSLQGKWTFRLPAEWQGTGIEYFNNMRIFNNTIYVCANNMLSLSRDDGESWTNLTSFTINHNHDDFYPPTSSAPVVADVYVDELNHVYMLCSYDIQNGDYTSNYSYLLRSSDQLQTWDYLLFNLESPHNSMTAYGDNLYLESDDAVRVWNKKTGTVKLFNSQEMRGNLFANKMYVDSAVNGKWYVPTFNSGVAIASLADVEQYPALWSYADTSAGLSTNTITCITGVDDTSAASTTAVYAGGNKGLSVTIDGGKTWSQIVRTRTGVILSEKVINGLDYYYSFGYTNVAVATSDDGIVRIIDSSTGPEVIDVHYTTSNGLASNTVQCVCIPRNGAIIAGHLGQGLSVQPTMTALTWKVLTKKDGLAGDYFWSVKGDRDTGKRIYGAGYDLGPNGKIGALSISTDGGSTWTAIQKFNIGKVEVEFAEITDVLEDSRWNEGKPIIYICATGVDAPSSYALLRSSDFGKSWTWFGGWDLPTGSVSLPCRPRMEMTADGMLYIVDSSKVAFFKPDSSVHLESNWADGLSGSNSGAIFIDRTGQIYVGTDGRGVAISSTSFDLSYEREID